MQSAATVLDVLGKRGARGLPVERLYRQLFNVLCRRCHEDIHAGRVTAPNNDHWRAA